MWWVTHFRALTSLDLRFWSLRSETQEQVESIAADCYFLECLVKQAIFKIQQDEWWFSLKQLGKVRSTLNPFLVTGRHLVAWAIPLASRDSQAFLTQDCDGGVTLLWGVSVELAEVSPFIRNWDVCQWHFEFTARKIEQLKPAVLQSCETKHSQWLCKRWRTIYFL